MRTGHTHIRASRGNATHPAFKITCDIIGVRVVLWAMAVAGVALFYGCHGSPRNASLMALDGGLNGLEAPAGAARTDTDRWR
jgi:hypothetical protein